MFKNILSKRVKNLLNTMVMPAILYAENLIGKGFGEAKKQAAIDFILGKLPVFFNNVQEVTDYIEASFTQCKDEAEKFAAKEIIMEEIG